MTKEKTQSHSLKDYNLLSLFDGIGCFPLAFANQTNIDHQKLKYDSSEYEDYLIDILNSNFSQINQLGDITKINWEHLYANKKLPDIITMGTPCTGFSNAGKRDGLENKESILFIEGIKCLKTLKPKYFLWENVFGSLSNNKGKDFRAILKEFANIGYNVTWTTYDTKYFGLPQKRRRVYMIGVRDDLNQSKNLAYIDPFNLLKRIKNNSIIDYENHINNFYSNHTNNDIFYFNRQRSDFFKSEGIASTITKRDYKSFGDLIIYNNIIRRETPLERLRLQGMPDYWFDEQYMKIKDHFLYRANGMSLPVVESVFNSLNTVEINRFQQFFSVREKTEQIDHFIDTINKSNKDSYQILKDPNNLLNSKGKKEGRVHYSGIMVKNSNEEYQLFLLDSCSEAPLSSIFDYQTLKIKDTKSIFSIIDKNASNKYNLSQRAIDGILRREKESNKSLPQDLRNKIKDIYNK